MITLYHRGDCPFCWKVRLALAELNLQFESVETRLGQKHPAVLEHSPTDTVPVLVDGDTVIWESSVIIDYLDARYSPGKLIPEDAAEAAQMRLFHVYSDKVVGSCLKDLVFEKRSKPAAEWDLDLIAASEKKWMSCQQWLEQRLNDDEFFGGSYSSADCALAARFGVAEAYGSALTPEYPRLHRWFESVKARDSWATAYPASFIRADNEKTRSC